MRRVTIGLLVLVALALSAPAWAQALKVTADRTNLREKPTTDSVIVVAVSKGDELEVLEKTGNWYKVRVKSTGREGYINGLVVEVLSGVPTTPASASPSVAPPPRPGPPTTLQPTPTNVGSDRQFFVRLYGGLFSGFVNTGPGFGGGIAGRPFGNEKLEVQGDFHYAHLGGWNFQDFFTEESIKLSLYQGSTSLLYNFQLPSRKFTPFAGAGLAYSNTRLKAEVKVLDQDVQELERLAGVTFVSGIHFQLVGGIELPINDRRAFRAEIRAGFPGVVLLGGISF